MNNTITRIQLIPTSPENISGYLDVDQRVPVPINYAISDIRDPQKRTGSFSKTITLPGTKNNNSLLSYLFDINITEVIDPITSKPITFSVKKLYRCILLQDGIPLHENELSLQLIAVNKRQDQLTEDDIIEYQVVVRDDVAQFFSQVANRKLNEIDFSEFNHIISSATVINSWAHTWVDGYKYMLPFRDGVLWFFNDAILGVYAKQYWNKIHADAGFSYEFFNNVEPQDFDKLIVPSNQSTDNLNQLVVEQNTIKVTSNTPQNFTFTAFFNGPDYQVDLDAVCQLLSSQPLNLTTIIQDTINQFTLPNSWDPALVTNNQYELKISFDYSWLVQNPNAHGITIVNDQAGAQIVQVFPNVIRRHSCDLQYGLINAATNNIRISGPPQNSTISETTSVGQGYLPSSINLAPNSIVNNYNTTLVVPFTLPPETLNSIIVSQLANSQGILRTITTGVPSFPHGPWSLLFRIENVNLEIKPLSDTIILNQNIPVTLTVPDMTQSDFLRSIYTMYNLYVVPDKVDSNKLIYYTRDDFYRNGGNKDWTHKMARDVQQNLEFLPELRDRQIKLTYKEDDDPANDFYTNITKEIYGQKVEEFDIEWTKGQDVKSIEFSTTPGGRNVNGLYLPYIQRSNNPRILIDNGNRQTINDGTNNILIADIFPSATFPSSVYPFFSHFNRPTNPTFDLNFGENPYYFYDIQVPTLNNLYNQFWRNTIQLIDKGQMLTAYFWLTPDDIFDLELNDVIRIDNSYWNINRIIDYDAGANRLTKVELITNSELLPLPLIPDSEIGDVEEPEPPEIEPGLFDLYSATTGSGGWSLNRRLTTFYSGPLFRVVRVSDLAELDITFNTFTGEVNQSELTTFIGSGTGRITRIYEQLSGNDLVQNNLLNMPRIINSGTLVQRGGNLVFEASTSEFFNFTTNLNDVNTEWSIWTVYEKSSTTNNAMLLASGGEYHWLDYGTTQAVQNIGSVAISPAIAPGNFVIWNSIIQSAVSASVWVNNSLRGSSAIAGGGTARSTLYPSSSFRGSTVYVGELVYYKTNQISDRANITTNINDFYGTY
jgi:hypothetical protein